MKSYGNLKLFHIIIDNYHDHAFFQYSLSQHNFDAFTACSEISSSSKSNKHSFLQHVFI